MLFIVFISNILHLELREIFQYYKAINKGCMEELQWKWLNPSVFNFNLMY